MTYHHKRAACSEETKEILQNVLQIKRAEYELLAESETIELKNPVEEILEEEGGTNVLPSEAEQVLGEVTEKKVRLTDAAEDGAGTEEYTLDVNLHFRIRQDEDSYKKKRTRNILGNHEIEYTKL